MALRLFLLPPSAAACPRHMLACSPSPAAPLSASLNFPRPHSQPPPRPSITPPPASLEVRSTTFSPASSLALPLPASRPSPSLSFSLSLSLALPPLRPSITTRLIQRHSAAASASASGESSVTMQQQQQQPSGSGSGTVHPTSSSSSSPTPSPAEAQGSGLATQKCVPCHDKSLKPLTGAEAETLQHQEVPGWEVVEVDGVLRLRRAWKTRNFLTGLDLFKRISEVAEAEGHHPDLHLEGWNNARVEIYTHSIGGLHRNDFILAAKIDALDVKDLLRKPKKTLPA